MSNNDYSKPAVDDNEAEERYKIFKKVDPFPEILPALLNSADFIDYAVTTGMIFPFNPQDGIKPASYQVKLGSEVLYWDDKNKRQYNAELTGKETIVFRKNSITFVTVAARFRLPDYIALRFNLQIHHVHRGLLLGTGPLVDPGFNGKLMIPIHNLTENDYEVDLNEGLIAIEFTKLSSNPRWESGAIEYKRNGVYTANDGRKDKKTFLDFIKIHVPQGKVRSSLLSTLADMTVKMKHANDTSKAIKATFATYMSWGSAGIAIAMIAIVISIYSLTADVNNYVADAKNAYIEKLNESADKVLLDINKQEFSTIHEEFRDLKKQLRVANLRILNLEKKVRSSKLVD